MADKRGMIDSVSSPSNDGYYPTAPAPDYTYSQNIQTNIVQQSPPQVHYQQQQGQVQVGVPGQVVIVRQAQPPPKDYMTLAVVVTFCCCLPFGIVGIIKASEAKSLYSAGNYGAAVAASSSAGTWSKCGLIFGIVLYGLVVAITVIWIAVIASIGY